MTENSRPWTGTATGDAGPYSFSDWAILQQYISGTVGGARANVGPFLGSGAQPYDGLRVTQHSAVNTQVTVGIGAAMVQGIFYLSDTAEDFTIAGNGSGNPRIDTVILRADYVAQTIRLAVLQGSTAPSPTPPTLTQTPGVTWEIPLANIAVASGFVSITNANISPRQEWVNAAPGVYLDNILNNSGGTLITGDIVIWDTSTDRAVTTTTTVDDPKTAGVWVGQTANGGYGRVLRIGIGYVNASAVVTRGNLLCSSATAKKADPLTTGIQNVSIGRALETTAGAGLVLTYVSVARKRVLEFIHVQDQKANTTVPASLTTGAWRTRELNTEVVDTASIASVAANQVTVTAGTYIVFGTAPNVNTGVTGRLRVRDTTGGVTLVQGTNGGASADALLSVFGYFTITVSSVLELQHFPNGTNAGGVPNSTGDVEVYANLYLWRIGEVS